MSYKLAHADAAQINIPEPTGQSICQRAHNLSASGSGNTRGKWKWKSSWGNCVCVCVFSSLLSGRISTLRDETGAVSIALVALSFEN